MARVTVNVSNIIPTLQEFINGNLRKFNITNNNGVYVITAKDEDGVEDDYRFTVKNNTVEILHTYIPPDKNYLWLQKIIADYEATLNKWGHPDEVRLDINYRY